MTFDPAVWGTVSDWLIVGTAIVAAWFGWEQLKRVAQESARQADVARATLMLQIDQIFEGADVGASRMAIRTLRNECEARALVEEREDAARELLPVSARLFSAQVTKVYLAYKQAEGSSAQRTDASEVGSAGSEPAHIVAGRRYVALMTLPYWMETVGLLTRKGLMIEADVLDLYDAVFVGVLTCFDAHIVYRREEKSEPDNRFLEHAMWLRDRAIARNATLAAAARREQIS